MKCTPAWTITLAFVRAASRASARHAVEDFRRHVIVAQDHGLALALEPVDLGDQGRMDRPLDLGNDFGDARVEPAGGLGDRVCIGQLDTHALLLMPPVQNNAQFEYISGVKNPAFKGRI